MSIFSKRPNRRFKGGLGENPHKDAGTAGKSICNGFAMGSRGCVAAFYGVNFSIFTIYGETGHE